jgi:hypothetical protein
MREGTWDTETVLVFKVYENPSLRLRPSGRSPDWLKMKNPAYAAR